MTIDVDMGLLDKTDSIGVLIYSLLVHLEQGSFGCRITQVEIADRLQIAKSTVSKRIKHLIALDLIEYSNRYKRFVVLDKS